nr:hypothetical protein [Tanacetum cinerariifolium]
MVKELMDPGVIRASQSPFLSPIVTVKKKDVFSKLDLRSGYHLIRMKEDDICKTTFRTHEGRYEFFVTPFDPSKIEAIQKWPIPSTLKQLRGFLDLTGYYRRFIKYYASISQPLVALTKKYAFKWNPSAELAYHKLKEAMIKALVLALPNFEQEFVVETDASGKEIGAVLCQNGHPIAYWSKTLSAKHQALLTYEKEFLGVVWLSKLLGHDYEIVYKKGSENIVADALSKVDLSGELLRIIISSVSSGVWNKVKDSWKNYLDNQNLIKSMENHMYKGNKYFWIGEILKRKGKVLDQVYTLHGLPESIMNDRDKVFLINFWKALIVELKVKLKLSTAYHPQTDGQAEVINRSLGCYLRCMCGEKPKEWKELEKLPTDWSCQIRVRSIQSSTFHNLRNVMDKESLRRMELIQAKSEVKIVGLKKLVLLAGVSTASRS